MGCKLCGNSEWSSASQRDVGLRAFDERRFREAYDRLRPCADSGDPVAQCRIGSLLQLGMVSIESNCDEAADYYRRAGEAGCALSWNNLATIYAVGTETRGSNRDAARKCFDKALELGFDGTADNPYNR